MPKLGIAQPVKKPRPTDRKARRGGGSFSSQSTRDTARKSADGVDTDDMDVSQFFEKDMRPLWGSQAYEEERVLPEVIPKVKTEESVQESHHPHVVPGRPIAPFAQMFAASPSPPSASRSNPQAQELDIQEAGPDSEKEDDFVQEYNPLFATRENTISPTAPVRAPSQNLPTAPPLDTSGPQSLDKGTTATPAIEVMARSLIAGFPRRALRTLLLNASLNTPAVMEEVLEWNLKQDSEEEAPILAQSNSRSSTIKNEVLEPQHTTKFCSDVPPSRKAPAQNRLNSKLKRNAFRSSHSRSSSQDSEPDKGNKALSESAERKRDGEEHVPPKQPNRKRRRPPSSSPEVSNSRLRMRRAPRVNYAGSGDSDSEYAESSDE